MKYILYTSIKKTLYITQKSPTHWAKGLSNLNQKAHWTSNIVSLYITDTIKKALTRKSPFKKGALSIKQTRLTCHWHPTWHWHSIRHWHTRAQSRKEPYPSSKSALYITQTLHITDWHSYSAYHLHTRALSRKVSHTSCIWLTPYILLTFYIALTRKSPTEKGALPIKQTRLTYHWHLTHHWHSTYQLSIKHIFYVYHWHSTYH